MGLRKARYSVRGKTRGSPTKYAKAEIMVMREKTKRFFFGLLDLIALVSLALAIYSFYIGNYLNGGLVLGVGVIILAYYCVRNYLVSRRRGRRRR